MRTAIGRASRSFVLLLLSLGFSAGAWPRPLQEVLNQGNLRIGIALATPWTIRAGDGELLGFEIDVAENLAEVMGVEPIFLVYDWDKIILALESGEVDIVAGLAITPERALHVNFSQPYAVGGDFSRADVQILEPLHARGCGIDGFDANGVAFAEVGQGHRRVQRG